MRRKQIMVGIASIVVGLIVVLVIVLYPKPELNSLKDYEKKLEVIAFRIGDEVFTYGDLQYHIRYEAHLKQNGNNFVDANPKATLVDEFFNTLYRRDATARGIIADKNEIKSNVTDMVKASHDIGGGLREVQEAMRIDEAYFINSFMSKLMETEIIKQYLLTAGIHHIFQFKAFDTATTQGKDMKQYHSYLITTYYDELYTEDRIIANHIEKLVK